MVSPVQYLREVATELQKVSWPSRQHTIRMTALVIGVSTLVALYIAGLDLVFNKLLGFLFTR